MYRPDFNYQYNIITHYEENKIDKKVKEDFDKVEIEKTNKKINIINKILNEENSVEDISDLNFDLTDFKFTIGDQVIYDNKEYIITDCLDELIKIKLIENNTENEFKVKGYHEIKNNNIQKEKKSFWIETDYYNLRIKKLYENEYNNISEKKQ